MSVLVPLDRVDPVLNGLPPDAPEEDDVTDEVPAGVEDEGGREDQAADLNGAVVAWEGDLKGYFSY